MSLWAHLFPSFDTWWPNIYAGFYWSPFVALIMWLLHRTQRAWIRRENARHHAAIRVTMAAHHAAVRRLLYGNARTEDIVADYPAAHDAEPPARPVQPARPNRAGRRVEPRGVEAAPGRDRAGRHRVSGGRGQPEDGTLGR